MRILVFLLPTLQYKFRHVMCHVLSLIKCVIKLVIYYLYTSVNVCSNPWRYSDAVSMSAVWDRHTHALSCRYSSLKRRTRCKMLPERSFSASALFFSYVLLPAVCCEYTRHRLSNLTRLISSFPSS